MGNANESETKLNLQKPSGTVDYFPEDMEKRRWLTRVMEDHFQKYGFEQVMIPIYDFFNLYKVRSGEKIINDIFTFMDPPKHRAEENPPLYALRPEFTAPLVRAYISSELMYRPKPQKYFYIGPCFRYDEPTKGRYRQFTQAGLEIFGADSASADAEMMIVPMDLLKKLGITDYLLRINDLTILRAYLEEREIKEDKQHIIFGIIDNITGYLRKLEIGALKDRTESDLIDDYYAMMQEAEIEREVTEDLEEMLHMVGNPEEILKKLQDTYQQYPKTLKVIEQSKLESVCNLLEAAGISNYVIDCGIARGLDYYTDIVFEIDVPSLGKQKQVCGGGRYNQLVQEFGGEETPACGFSFGFDRVLIVLEEKDKITAKKSRADVFIGMKERSRVFGMQIAEKLRLSGIKVEIDLMDRSFRSAAKLVNRLEIPYMLFIGPREEEAQSFTLKNFITEKQMRDLTLEQVIQTILDNTQAVV